MDPGVLAGDVQLLFISLESILNNKHFGGMLLSQQYNIVAVAVDETHCVNSWYVARICTQFAF